MTEQFWEQPYEPECVDCRVYERQIATLRSRVEELEGALEKIRYEASQYGDGAEDSHYLAREMLSLEAIARAALPQRNEG